MIAAALVILGNLASMAMGFETWQMGSQPILLAFGVLGIHPVLS